VPVYEVVDRSTGALLLRAGDREEAARAVRDLERAGRGWDDLDLVEVAGGRRRRLLLPIQESAVRSLLAAAPGRPARAFRTLAEAQAGPAAAVILEGDAGGQIFATCPAGRVRCAEARLRQLARELAGRTWASAGADSARVRFEPLPVGAGVAGGMGGGRVEAGVWVHEELRQLGWAAAVEGVLLGTLEALPDPRPEVPPDVRAGILRAYAARIDVFCDVFGFPCPRHLWTLPLDEWRRREQAVVPPPAHYTRWYPSTYRAVLVQARSASE
jgi:hypothetical protein